MSGIHWQFGVVQNQAATGGGGGGTIPFTIDGIDYSLGTNTTVTNCLNGGLINTSATDGTGNADRGIFVDFADGSTGTNKQQSTFGTASSPTRTTQTVHVRTSQVQASITNTPQFALPILIGGKITQGNMGTISNIHWQTTSVSSSLSNGCSTFSQEVSDAHEHNQNNTIEDDFFQLITNGSGYQNTGIYDDGTNGPFAFTSGTGYYVYALTFGGGRGTPTFPAVNDTITIRITVDADISGTTHSVIHDFIIKFI